MNNLPIIILVLFFLDMYLSHSYIGMYKEKYPKNDWTLAESNPIIRFCIRKFDLDKGMFIGGMLITFILFVVFAIARVEILYMMIGMYWAVNVQHFVNNRAMKKLITKEVKK